MAKGERRLTVEGASSPEMEVWLGCGQFNTQSVGILETSKIHAYTFKNWLLKC